MNQTTALLSVGCVALPTAIVAYIVRIGPLYYFDWSTEGLPSVTTFHFITIFRCEE
jgi:hypothetical protein